MKLFLIFTIFFSCVPIQDVFGINRFSKNKNATTNLFSKKNETNQQETTSGNTTESPEAAGVEELPTSSPKPEEDDFPEEPVPKKNEEESLPPQEEAASDEALEVGADIGSRIAKLAKDILNAIGLAPGLSYIAELGRKGVDKAKELWDSFLPYIYIYAEVKFDVMTAVEKEGHQLMDSAAETGVQLVDKMVETGEGMVQSSTVAAQHFTNLLISAVKSTITIFGHFKESLNKTNQIINETRELLRPHLDTDD